MHLLVHVSRTTAGYKSQFKAGRLIQMTRTVLYTSSRAYDAYNTAVQVFKFYRGSPPSLRSCHAQVFHNRLPFVVFGLWTKPKFDVAVAMETNCETRGKALANNNVYARAVTSQTIGNKLPCSLSIHCVYN